MLWASGSSLPMELCAADARLAAREVFDASAPRPDEARVDTESTLTVALQNPAINTITLTSDIIVMSDITINRQGKLTLNLGGCKIASLKAHASAIDVQAGDIVITGQGSIVANGFGSAGIRIKGAMTAENSNYASVVLDREVTLYAPHSYGIYLAANFNAAYGVTIEVRGKIVARDGIGVNRMVQGQGEHAPQITIADQAMIEVDADEGTALSAAGYAHWQIGAADITGATGVSIKAGKMEFRGTTLAATGELANPSGWDNTVGVGAVVQIEENADYAGEIYLNFDGGKYSSHQSYLVAKYGSAKTLRQLEILAGDFAAPSGAFYGLAPSDDRQGVVSVLGGNFFIHPASELSDYLADGRYLEVDKTTGAAKVIDPNPPQAEIDPVEQLALETAALEALIERAKVYLGKEYIGDELGDWQDPANKAVAAIKRAIKASEKLLRSPSATTLDQVLHLQKRIKTTLRNVAKIADELHGEMLSVLATAQELDPSEYSAYSYRALSEAMLAAESLSAQPEASLNQLYSAFCDLELNIDLLEEPEDETDIALPLPVPAPVPTPMPTIVSEPLTTPQEVLPEPVPEEPEIEPIMELEPEDEPISELESEFAAAPEPSLDEIDTWMGLGATAILATLNESVTEISAAVELTPDELQTGPAVMDMLEPFVPAMSLPAPAPAPFVASVPSAIAQPLPTMAPAAEPVDELALQALADARSSLYLMLDAVQDLALQDYQAEYAEQFGELQVAIAKAGAVLQKADVALPEILDVMDELKFATAGLQLEPEPVAPAPSPEPKLIPAAEPANAKSHLRLGTVALAAMSKANRKPALQSTTDWSALREVVADIAKLEASDYTHATYANVLANLERAKLLLSNTAATQNDVDDLVFDLNLSMLGLERNVQAPVSQQFMSPAANTNPNPALSQADIFADQSVTPNLLMSMMAGAYAGLATYRKSRLAAKKRRVTRKTQVFSKV